MQPASSPTPTTNASSPGKKTSNSANSRITEALRRQVEDVRLSISKFRVLDNRNTEEGDYSQIPNKSNIIIFGPTGSGKSSLIRTFFNALHGTFMTPENNEELRGLVIQQHLKNEGTTQFQTFVLKKEKNTVIDAGDRKVRFETSEINLMDTRGQILMDEKEIKQLNMIIDGKVKDMSVVEQRNWRYAYLLWEFWKKDSDLFPKEIIAHGTGLSSQPHAVIFVFDGSLEEIPNGEEETRFYKDIINQARDRKFFYPQIVLTRVDKIEEKLNKLQAKGKISEMEKEIRLREEIDAKIEQVVIKLGIPRTSVHFIENYHEKHTQNEVSIDYYALKLLAEALKQGDSFLQTKIIQKSRCIIQ